MEKLTKETYIKHAKRIYAILNEKSPLVKFLSKKDFASIIEQQLNLLYALENKFKQEKVEDQYKTSSLVKIYNKATNGNFKINSKFKLEDDADYIDGINYLITYCKNIFKVNLDDLASGKEVKVATPTTPFKQATDVDDRPNVNAAFGAMGMGMGAFMDPKQNPFIISQATVQLQKEMADGRFYRYKTKPTAIPKIKIFGIVLSMLTCLSLIIMAILSFVSTNLIIELPSSNDDPIYHLASYWEGIFYILFAGIGIFNIYTMFKSTLTKNPNDKYFFPWQILLIFVIGSLLAVLLGISTVFEIGYLVKPGQEQTAEFAAFIGLKIMWYIAIASIGLTIIPIIIGGVLNPKPDLQGVESRMGEIIDQLVSGYGFGSTKQQTPDVQSPVDVKKPEDKPKKDDKQSSSTTEKPKK